MNGRAWTDRDNAVMRAMYPHRPTREVARKLRRKISVVYMRAGVMGLRKSEAFFALPASGRIKRNEVRSRATQFKRGHRTWNTGLHYRAGGRSAETRFKKGQWPVNKDPDFYVIGALRVNSDGYIEMRTSFRVGSYGWTGLHRILWEDRNGPIPKNHVVCFKNGDPLDCWHDNFELVSRRDLMLRNTIHARYPQPLKQTVMVLGQLKRRIREKQNRGLAQSPVRDAGGSAR